MAAHYFVDVTEDHSEALIELLSDPTGLDAYFSVKDDDGDLLIDVFLERAN